MKINRKQRQINISEEIDIAKAVAGAKSLAQEIGFKETQQYAIATATSEMARNIYRYATKGKIILKATKRKLREGIEVIAQDNGPGIEDISKAMEENFSTSNSLGLGLPGVKRLMDEFVFDNEFSEGTKIITRKWM